MNTEKKQSAEHDHPPCCGSACEGASCWDCRGTGHPHAPSTPLEKAASRVREWLIARDAFYGREAGEDDVLATEAVYDGENLVGHAQLSLGDLRTLVGAPGPETYDDRTEAYWSRPTPPDPQPNEED